MNVSSNGGSDFRKLAGRFKAAGAGGAAIRKRLTAAIQVELKATVAEIQQEARALVVRGVAGHGTRRREQFHAAHHKRARRGGHGLRESTARAVKSKVAYSGHRIGAQIYVNARDMPQSQRKLPAYLNREKGWRHPVWGHRRVWVSQVASPSGYFDRPIARRIERMRTAVRQAVAGAMKELER